MVGHELFREIINRRFNNEVRSLLFENFVMTACVTRK